mmetsp:Transcript_27230/g.33662  ORF Transcript_27230/g.33662 Transcript_27230/m.33662 type:complete len:701 (+) Transcript_27230:45-2147(+)
MNTSSKPDNSLIIIGKPKWKRQFQTTNIDPLPIQIITPTISNNNNGNNSNTKKNNRDININSININNSSQVICCPICKNHQARYTCPKCAMPYCSVSCYRIHDVKQQNQRQRQHQQSSSSLSPMSLNNYDTEFSGGSCTENFYRHKVQEICNLDVQHEDNRMQMKDILTRSFYDTEDKGEESNIYKNSGDDKDDGENIGDGDDDDDDDDDDGNSKILYHQMEKVTLTDDELLELSKHIFLDHDHPYNNNNDIEDDDYEEDNNYNNNEDFTNFLEKIPQHLRSKFEQAVQRGELSHLIQPWHPYWLPNFKSKFDTTTVRDDVVVNQESTTAAVTTTNLATLDERILSIPNLVRTKMKPSTSTSKSISATSTTTHHVNRTQLQYNICEVLYISTWMLRLYNGGESSLPPIHLNDNDDDIDDDDNRKKDDSDSMLIVIHSASFLFSQSFVLANDKRYTNVTEVLMDCTSKSTRYETHIVHGRNIHGNDNDNGHTSTYAHNHTNNIIDWKVLVNDLIYICQNKRMVLRVLFHVMDIMNKAYKNMKKVEKQEMISDVNRCGSRNNSSSSNKRSISSSLDDIWTKKKGIRLARKKLEYFLSWTKSNWNDSMSNEITNDAELWIERWILNEDDQLSINEVTMMRHGLSTRTGRKENDAAKYIKKGISTSNSMNGFDDDDDEKFKLNSGSSSKSLLTAISTKTLLKRH